MQRRVVKSKVLETEPPAPSKMLALDGARGQRPGRALRTRAPPTCHGIFALLPMGPQSGSPLDDAPLKSTASKRSALFLGFAQSHPAHRRRLPVRPIEPLGPAAPPSRAGSAACPLGASSIHPLRLQRLWHDWPVVRMPTFALCPSLSEEIRGSIQAQARND